jgi:peptide/nickel transport system substrate-binding protein
MKIGETKNISIPGMGLLVLAGLLLAWAGSPSAAEQPQRGGILTYAVGNESATLDAHQESTYGCLHPVAPFYSLLLKWDEDHYPKIVGDLAESWTVSPDYRTYTFRIRKGVKFHDGTLLTSRDVKASYDKIISPPSGVISVRDVFYSSVEKIETPDDHTVVFRLRWPTASFLSGLASPWNFIYKADILAKDPHWYEKNVMGTGPFKLQEAGRGTHFAGIRNNDYFRKGLPYLDGFRAVFIPNTGTRLAAIRGGRVMTEFRGFPPSQIEELVKAMGNKIQIMESPLTTVMTVQFNTEKKPFNDPQVRRALVLAIDQWGAAKVLSKITVCTTVGGGLRPGAEFALSEEELTQIPAFSKDMEANRKEARRLLREAGVPEGFSFQIINRPPPMPYEPIAVWLIDQWRKIGLNVIQKPLELGPYWVDLRAGRFDVAVNSHSAYMDDPDDQFVNYVSSSSLNPMRYKDPILDDLYLKQSRAIDPAERRRLCKQFQMRLFDEMTYMVPFLWWHRMIPVPVNVKGVKLLPNHFINQDRSTIWLSKD